MSWLRKLIEKFWSWLTEADYEALFWKAYPHVAPVLAGGLQIGLEIVLRANPGWTALAFIKTMSTIVRQVVAQLSTADMSNNDKRKAAIQEARELAERQGLKELPGDVVGYFVDSAARILFKALGDKWKPDEADPVKVELAMAAVERHGSRHASEMRMVG